MVKGGRFSSTPSASTDSDGRQVKFLKERTEADEARTASLIGTVMHYNGKAEIRKTNLSCSKSL